MTKGNYDNVAPYYDLLSRLIYGHAIDKAHLFLVSFIPPDSSLLIVGGGTGKILKQIADVHSKGLNIFYVDSSAKMIKLAKEKCVGKNEISFINDTIENVTLSIKFDVIITPFFFDNFSNHTAAKIFSQLNQFLKHDGLWLFADFQGNNFFQKGLLKIMYTFFRLTCGIEAKQLPDTTLLFEKAAFEIKSSQNFFGNFIITNIYCRE